MRLGKILTGIESFCEKWVHGHHTCEKTKAACEDAEQVESSQPDRWASGIASHVPDSMIG